MQARCLSNFVHCGEHTRLVHSDHVTYFGDDWRMWQYTYLQ